MPSRPMNPMNEISVFTDIPFAETPQKVLKLDLRVPRTAAPPPLVVYIPVGGMRLCARDKAPRWLLEHGFAIAAIDCRVSSEAIAPAQVHDCKSAVRWLRAHAAEYGFRGDRLGAWGHSAGGLLASMLATSGGVAALEGEGPCAGVSSRVQAACDECGAPHDFSWFARPDIKQRFAPVAENLRLYLGGAVEEKAALARLASPSAHVSRECPPVLLIHGEADQTVPVEETIEFHGTLRAAGVDATLVVLPGAGHGWDAALTRDRIVAFFRRTLGGD